MPSLPTELLIDIIDRATHIPHLLSIVPKPSDDDFLCDYEFEDTLDDFIPSLRTRHALSLVCRSFNAVTTPILYSCLLLSSASTRNLRNGITDENASLVFHVLLDLNAFTSATLASLPSIFIRLPNVRALSIYANLGDGNSAPPIHFASHITDSMASPFGPTLRRLALYRHALAFFEPHHFASFTFALVHLEALVAPNNHAPPNVHVLMGAVRLPTSVPHLRYLNVPDSSFVLSAPAAPAYARRPLADSLHHILCPALTHLSIVMDVWCVWTAYDSIAVACPNLVALTLSGGTLSELVFLLRAESRTQFPAVSQLIFEDILLEEWDDGIVDEETGEGPLPVFGRMQLWVDALAMLRARAPTLSVARVVDEVFLDGIRKYAREGKVRVNALEGCGFVVEDGKGRALLDGLQVGGPS
ncbi:hypothetical protein OF83DRAFT_533188 [Amylostereum chailletii]|nr:hypothetical protein OF83DRAFT_533188 [Amylostereum chailletii]